MCNMGISSLFLFPSFAKVLSNFGIKRLISYHDQLLRLDMISICGNQSYHICSFHIQVHFYQPPVVHHLSYYQPSDDVPYHDLLCCRRPADAYEEPAGGGIGPDGPSEAARYAAHSYDIGIGGIPVVAHHHQAIEAGAAEAIGVIDIIVQV